MTRQSDLLLLTGFCCFWLCLPEAADAQYVKLKGYFIAGEACEATRKKGRDNPGNVKLKANRAYELRGRNATPGTHYQIVVPGVPGTDIRWVSMACGVYAAKKGETETRTGNAATRPEPRTGRKEGTKKPEPRRKGAGTGAMVPGLKKNSLEHVLAASWQPGFCKVQPRRRECRTMTAQRFDADHFSLHGLWPDDLDDRAIFPCYCNTGTARSCSLKLRSVNRIELSDTLRAQLRTSMPGMMSGLHLHQWTKHGSCYEADRRDGDRGSDAEEYFGETLGLLEQLNRSAVRDLFAANVGRTVTARQIGRAFDEAFGARAGERVIVRCSKVDGRDVITELWISLGAGITPDTRLADLLRAAPPASVSSGARRCRSGLVAGVDN